MLKSTVSIHVHSIFWHSRSDSKSTQMEEYYKRRPGCSSSTSSNTENGGPKNNKTLSEYDQYCQSLVDNNDQDEGWNSEYWCYKKDRPADVKNNTDIVQWWQVCLFQSEDSELSC